MTNPLDLKAKHPTLNNNLRPKILKNDLKFQFNKDLSLEIITLFRMKINRQKRSTKSRQTSVAPSIISFGQLTLKFHGTLIFRAKISYDDTLSLRQKVHCLISL